MDLTFFAKVCEASEPCDSDVWITTGNNQMIYGLSMGALRGLFFLVQADNRRLSAGK